MFKPGSNHRLYTSLDTLETSGQRPPDLCICVPSNYDDIDAEYETRTHGPMQAFRHAGWAPLRQRIWKSLARTNQSTRRKAAFRDCGRYFYVLQSHNDPTKHVLGCGACKDRLCLPCGNTRSRCIAQAISKKLSSTTCRFVTLTLRSTTEPLSHTIDRLYAAFNRLKRTRFWKKKVRGGVAFLEITRNERTRYWHPHLHLITNGQYIETGLLSHAWHAATGDSHIIDVRLVRDSIKAVQYVTKYASKPYHHSTTRDDASLDEITLALAGRRTIIAFGNWRKIGLTAAPKKGEWHNVGTVDSWADRASAGDDNAWQVLHSLTGDLARLLVAEAETRAPPTYLRPKPPPPPPEQLYFALVNETAIA